MAKVLTIASGKGGVGKTSISLNLSLALANAGYRVCLFDADLGLANVNILTGLYPDQGLAEVIDSRNTLSGIMIRNFNGIDMIPGSSGVEKLADLTESQARTLIRAFLDLPDYDYFILDTSAGISAQVLSFCRASHEMILVATPEPTSLTDAYSLLKVLSRGPGMPRVRVVINQVRSAPGAKQAYAKLKKTVQKFLSVEIAPLGIVARDPNVPIAVVSQIPFFTLFPDTPASRCIRSIALKLVKDPGGDMPVEAFWDQCLDLLSGQGTEQKPTRRPKAAPSPEKSPGPDSEELLARRMDAMEEKMALLLDEIRAVKALVSQGPSPAGNPVPEPKAPPLPAKPVEDLPDRPLVLDFEGWLAGR